MSYFAAPIDASETEAPTVPARPGGLGWFVESTVVPEGHELLTRHAAAGLPLSARELGLLREGVRRPDTASLTAHVVPGEQRRHFLRQTILHTVSTAHREATDHLRSLHGRILALAAGSDEQFRLIGEALHLVQDSFAPAHVDRDASTGRIRYIRNFGPANLVPPLIAPLPSLLLPGEHGFPADGRDRVHSGLPYSGTLKPEAQRAVDASREYLVMTLRHVGSAIPLTSARAELEGFIRRQFPL
jgi:hypothetical protein